MSHLIAVPDNQIQPAQIPPAQTLPTQPTAQFTRKEILEILQREIQYTQTMIGSRMTWYVTSQSFLVTAFAISGGSGHNFQWLAKGVIPALGIILSIVISFSISAALPVLVQLRTRALELMDSQELRDLPFMGFQPNSAKPSLRSRMAPLVVPIMFVFIWLSALILVWNFTPDF
jgi:hypothetical protein